MFKITLLRPILKNPAHPGYAGLFLMLNSLFFFFGMLASPFFLPRFSDFPGHRFAGEMSRASGADDLKFFGGFERLLDPEIFHFARNLRLPFIIDQALPPGARVAESDFDPVINRIFSQF